MKKILALVLALSALFVFAACSQQPAVMTHEEYVAAALDTEVVVEAYVQAKQDWWEDKATVYAQAEDGAYFIYEMPITEEEYAKLVPGTKLRITGIKAEWSGEVEIIEAKYEILEGEFIAEALDVTDLLGKDELIDHQNEFVSFKEMTVEKVEYKNGEAGDDIYVTLSKDGASYDFCVEVYLTGTETEVYKAVGELDEGDVINAEGFLYWYEGANPHLTAVEVVKEAESDAAPIEDVEVEGEAVEGETTDGEAVEDEATEGDAEAEVEFGDNEFVAEW